MTDDIRPSALLDLTFSICRVVCQANPADAARQIQIWKRSSQGEIRLKSVPRKVPTITLKAIVPQNRHR